MIRVELPVGLFFLGVGAYVMVAAWDMRFFSALGPGPGFFPFCVGALLFGLTAIWMVRTVVGPRIAMPAETIPSRGALWRIAGVLGALVAYALVLDTLGFRLTMLAFLFVTMIGPGRQSLLRSAVIAVVGSFGGAYMFSDLLDVHLPRSTFAVFDRLGL